MINQTQIITIFVMYASLSLVLYLLKTIIGETKYNQYIKNNIYYIPLVQMFDNLLIYDELILFKLILVLIIYININITGELNENPGELNDNLGELNDNPGELNDNPGKLNENQGELKDNLEELKELQKEVIDNIRASQDQLTPPAQSTPF